MSAKYQDIFVPGGFPRLTYNPREKLQLEAKLAETRDNLCKLATVTGQTKSGKTVLTRKVLPQEDSIWIDGGTVSSEQDFWDVIINRLELFQLHEIEDSREERIGLNGEATAEAGLIVAKGSATVGGRLEDIKGSVLRRHQDISSRVIALAVC